MNVRKGLTETPGDDKSAEQEQYELMDRFVEPEPLTQFERAIQKLKIGYLPAVFLCVVMIYGFNYSLFMYFAPGIYQEGSAKLSELYFNPIFLIADSVTMLFCAWFVKYQSRMYVEVLRDVRHLLDFPSKEKALASTDRITIGRILLDILWSRPYAFTLRHRRAAIMSAVVIIVALPLYVIWRFPVSSGYEFICPYLVMFILGTWATTHVTWVPPSSKYRGINRNLWTAFKSNQAGLATIFTMSIAFAEVTWVTYIPTMQADTSLLSLGLWPDLLLRLEVYVGYLPLFAFLANLAHTICSVAVGIIFLWHRRYMMVLDPLDEFGSGGFKPLGTLAEKNTYAIGITMLLLFTSRFVVYPLKELSKPYYLQLLTGSSVLVFFSYLIPTLMLHSRIRALKLIWVREIRKKKFSMFQEKATALGTTANNSRSANEKTSTSTSWARFEMMCSDWADGYSKIRDINEWPTSASLLAVLSASASPLISYLLSLYFRRPLPS